MINAYDTSTITTADAVRNRRLQNELVLLFERADCFPPFIISQTPMSFALRNCINYSTMYSHCWMQYVRPSLHISHKTNVQLFYLHLTLPTAKDCSESCLRCLHKLLF